MITISISPVAFSIGPVEVRWYGIMIALAIIVLVLWGLRVLRGSPRLSREVFLNATLAAIPTGIIFARLLHVLDQWDYYFHNPGQIIGGSGLAIYGGVLGAAFGAWIYSRFRKFPVGYLFDAVAPGIILAQAIGRVGCLLNGCCYGLETDIFCAIIYTNPASFGPLEVAVHPTQIYEIVYNLIVFGVLLKLRGRFRPEGSLFLIYLTLYSLWRFGIDFIREGTPFLFGLHEAQIVSIAVLIITVSLLAWRTRWVRAGADRVVTGPPPEGGASRR